MFRIAWKLVSSAGGNWKDFESRRRFGKKRRGEKKAVTGDEIDDPSGHYPQDRDYYPQF